MTMSRLRGADVAPFPSLPRVPPWPSHPLCFTLHISMQMQENTVTVGDAYHPVSLRTSLVTRSRAHTDVFLDLFASLHLHYYSLARFGSNPFLYFHTPGMLYMLSSHNQTVAALRSTSLLCLAVQIFLAGLTNYFGALSNIPLNTSCGTRSSAERCTHSLRTTGPVGNVMVRALISVITEVC